MKTEEDREGDERVGGKREQPKVRKESTGFQNKKKKEEEAKKKRSLEASAPLSRQWWVPPLSSILSASLANDDQQRQRSAAITKSPEVRFRTRDSGTMASARHRVRR